MIGYHFRLAVKSIARSPALSATMVVSLAIGVAIFVVARGALLGCWRVPPHRPGLQLVTIQRSVQLADVMRVPKEQEDAWESPFQTYLSFSEYQTLASIIGPAALSPTTSAEAALRVPGGPAALASLRLATHDLFSLFDIPMRYGRPFLSDHEVVLTEAASRRFLGTADGCNRTVFIAGFPFTVVGITDGVPFKPFEGRFFYPNHLEDVIVPFATLERLQLRPRFSFSPGRRESTFGDMLRASDRWIYLWVDPPVGRSRLAYESALATTIPGARLRPYAEVYAAFTFVQGPYEVLYLFARIALVASALNLLRLLLAKSMARRGEVGIHRALGATRFAVIGRQVLEAGLVGLAGGVLGLLLGTGGITLMNRLVPDRAADGLIDGASVIVALSLAVLIGATAGAYAAWRVTRSSPSLFLRQA